MKIPHFETKKELFAYLKANKKELIKMKKSDKKEFVFSDISHKPTKIAANKSESDTENLIKRTIIGNTYNWLDSHDDVHIKGCFLKSIKENEGFIFHFHDHENKVSAKVGTFTKIYEDSIKWSDLGIDKSGETTSLFADSDIKRSYNGSVFEQYKNGEITQHSVGMQYVKLDLAINDEAEGEEYKVWKRYINTLGNSDKAEQNGYFFVVSEAKLFEISAVTRASNSLTPTMDNKLDYSSIDNLAKIFSENLSSLDKENFNHICKQYKALQNNEPLDLALKTEKPQVKKSINRLLI